MKKIFAMFLLFFTFAIAHNDANFSLTIYNFSKFLKIIDKKTNVLYSKKNVRLLSFEESSDREWVYLNAREKNSDPRDEMKILINLKYEKEIPYNEFSKIFTSDFLGFYSSNDMTYLEGFFIGTVKPVKIPLNKTFNYYLTNKIK